MKPILLLAGLVFFQSERALSYRFIQHPETQHVLAGDNSTFSCATLQSNFIVWKAYFRNGSYAELTQNTRNVIGLTESHTNATITISARQSWNETRLNCHAENSGTDFFSNGAYLIIYSSLRPLPPSDLRINFINGSTAVVTWTPSKLWESYPIDRFSMVVTNGSSTLLSALVDSNIHEYILMAFSQPSCSELNFSIAAISSMYGKSEYTVVNKKFGSDLEAVSKHMNIDTMVYFHSNVTPIVEVEIQIPSTICVYEHWTINYTVIGIQLGSNSSISGVVNHPATAHIMHNPSFSIMHGLLVNQNYSLTITISTDSGESITTSTIFDTIFQLSSPLTCYYNEKPIASKFTVYKIALGFCLSAIILILIFLTIVLMWIYLHRGIERQSQKLNNSTSRVCNAMVHNPIYDGPVYESVQQQFNTLTATSLQASIASDTSNDHPCNSQPSTPNSSEKSVRYVDPPSSAQETSKTRSKSFLSQPSPPEGVTENIPRSTSVSVPVIKKQRNVLNLRLTLPGSDSTGASGSHSAQSSTAELISAVNQVVLREVDDNYAVMSPVAGRSALAGMAEWSELSPEDTDKYKE